MDETTHTPEDTPHSETAADLGLQQELAAAHAKAAENLEGWQRAQAEFANYKKRMARDQELQEAEVRGRVIKRYLEIVDDLELALKNMPAGDEWGQGIELIYRKLLSFLEAEGVTRLEPLGQPFDANLHEAVVQEDSDEHESGTVTEVLRTGYSLGERVLRPAAVKVAK
ncbi:MAG: nucleotide exchange factor GrpE [Anaerolineales bacterium]|nr:nucleotide exchange factor GrpE [Anaerolineales bacterium]MCL4257111.1 nucleotide exchange factor GrpE [Anaerolineales bacterium]